MKSNSLILLGLFTILVFPLLGWLITQFYFQVPFLSIFKTKSSYWLEIPLGAIYGFTTAMIGWAIIQSPQLKPVQKKYTSLINSLQLKIPQIIFLSLCAGIGEEILFRGAIQPIFGVWLTAIFFVAIHGYLNPTDWRISLYGGFMTITIAGIGFMAINFGLIASITAHTFIDVVLFYQLTNFEIEEDEDRSEI